jgi:hypothetical protein
MGDLWARSLYLTSYYIMEVDGGKFRLAIDPYGGKGPVVSYFDTLSAAKAAANEHNRQRIAERYLEVVETPTNKAVRKALQRFSNPDRPEPLKGSTVFDDERGAR